jgi:uncharacterized OB-fold protein
MMPTLPVTFNQFKDALRQDRLLGVYCSRCNSIAAPPTGACPDCGMADLEVRELTPKGTIRTFTVVRVGPEGFDPPYVICMVELDDGPWVLGNLEGTDPDKVKMDVIGKTVTVGHREFPLPEGECGVEGVALTFQLT